MYLIQILLPLRDNDGERFGRGEFDRVRTELTERFGGVTFFSRSPAQGVWKDDDGDVDHDDVLVAEVMARQQDRGWWRQYRQSLETRFRQEKIVARSIAFEPL
ncbi:MAG TPA: hypothetical protein VEX86_26750 [Longimicrobium sp.]|nr:hypothetical protein [Longimicrobium sp.]